MRVTEQRAPNRAAMADLAAIRRTMADAIERQTESYKSVAAFCGVHPNTMREFCEYESQPQLSTQHRLIAWWVTHRLGEDASVEKAREVLESALCQWPPSTQARMAFYVLALAEQSLSKTGREPPQWLRLLRMNEGAEPDRIAAVWYD